MNKLVFVSDFFADQIQGGAEICDDVLISALKDKGIKIARFNSKEFTEKHVSLYLKTGFSFLISNFTHLSEPVKKLLQVYPDKYCIIEHDHKYISNRNPAPFVDFMAPPQRIVNRDFYKSAKYVFCQSVKHAEVLSKNLKIDNVINLGCSLWNDEQLDLLERCSNNTKNGKHFVMGDLNPIKGLAEAKELCMSRELPFDVVEKRPYPEFIETLSRYDKLVFFPKTLESFCRVILEARMLNCGLVTNNLNGCTYEPWFRDLKGIELIDFVRSKRTEIVDLVADKLFETNQSETKQGDITVILNCYRRPYNLQMQVDALKAQSIKPKQIWLWINQHEDNENFDPTTLGVDRIFNNDYNWKFYGRFAAALLADTEYVAIYDDDTIPGRKWHENCLKTMETHEGILGSAGIILHGNRYVQHQRCGWPSQNEQTTEVDLVGHAWFFKREWLRYLWQEKPTTWDNGEDIQFAYMAKVHGGIPTYCPPHPPTDRELHGSILGNELGIDDKATSTNSAVSHQQFFSERDMCVQAGLKCGWETVRGVK
jgi:hypothetical protein